LKIEEYKLAATLPRCQASGLGVTLQCTAAAHTVELWRLATKNRGSARTPTRILQSSFFNLHSPIFISSLS
jgi:hypothetical protein